MAGKGPIAKSICTPPVVSVGWEGILPIQRIQHQVLFLGEFTCIIDTLAYLAIFGSSPRNHVDSDVLDTSGRVAGEQRNPQDVFIRIVSDWWRSSVSGFSW